MALPSTMFVATIGRPQLAGLTFEAYPSTVRGLPVEFQTATANSTASSLWASVIRPPTSAGPVRFHAAFPNSTKTYYCRARHPAGPGYSAGPFTATVSAKPEMKAEVQRRIAPVVTYKGNVEIPSGADMWISSGKTVKVGTQVTSGFFTKTILIGAQNMLPALNTATFKVVSGALYPGTANTPTTFGSFVPLPPGAVTIRFRGRVYRKGSSDSVAIELRDTNGVTLGLGSTKLSTGTTWHTISASTAALGSAGSTARIIFIKVILKGKNASSDARILFVAIDYKMPAYNVTI